MFSPAITLVASILSGGTGEPLSTRPFKFNKIIREEGALTVKPPGLGDTSGENNAAKLLVVMWLSIVLSGVFMGARLVGKMMKKKGLWWDDYILIISWAALIPTAILIIVLVSTLGHGKHVWDKSWLTPEQVSRSILMDQVAGSCLILSVFLSKTSFALTMHRVTKKHPKVRVAVWVAIVIMNLLTAVILFVQWLGCTPPAKLWKPWLEGKCFEVNAVLVLHLVTGGESHSLVE
ncbi:uncharacterized protein MKZ38_005288 [Zalerion maritima]|uniref:Rhodopsin domain-containing protein n=1 Tax=Zalerion maritima TaxID=339359 RepID=A0AAD5RLH7_9PEZI|nr:uncharacterized protein MKZ38_005288 [Zalerion maritima]